MTQITLRANYSHTSSMAPAAMKAPVIWSFAQNVRQQVLGSMWRKPVDPRHVATRLAAAMINGIALRFVWDFDNTVQDEQKRQVFGLCEHSPDEPGQIMISINAPALADRPELERSTLAHELGHALFDMPAAVHERRRLQLSLRDDNVQRLYRRGDGSRSRAGDMDWDEWRANEFMGAFLAPAISFHQALVRLANQRSLPMVHRPSLGKFGLPVLHDERLDLGALEEILNLLAEDFGVTPDFVRVRLRKYRLITQNEV